MKKGVNPKIDRRDLLGVLAVGAGAPAAGAGAGAVWLNAGRAARIPMVRMAMRLMIFYCFS